MRKFKYIALSVCILYSVFCTPIFAQDYARLSERSIMGTARYVGMSGAMTAIGGDPSSVFDNPAGLGLYQRSEVMLTFDERIDDAWQVDADHKNRRLLFMCPQASLVFCLPLNANTSSGVQFSNFMIGYRRMQTFNRTYEASSRGGVSFGSQLPVPALDIPFYDAPQHASDTLYLNTWGYTNEYTFDWSLNIGHQWYVGLGFHIQNYFLSDDASYGERFDTISVEGYVFSNRNTTSLQLSGVSCNLSAGFIYRPLQWLRLGFGIQTPTLGSLYTYAEGTLSAQTDSLRYSYAPRISNKDNGYHMPLHLSSSVAFQFGAYGMLSFQHDYLKIKNEDAVHSLRAGFEIVPVLGMYINAGYAYESTFKPADTPVPMDPSFDRQDAYFIHPRWSQYASCAIGYRGQRFIAQAAYQYRWQAINLFAHEAAEPYDIRTNTHRIVLTLAWH